MVEVRIEGPGKNALGTERMQELLSAIQAAHGEPLLLTGAGDAFAAGLDLQEVYEADLVGMKMVKARVSPAHWHELLLGAGLHGPKDALRLGLVDVLADDPLEVARATLAVWAKHPCEAYATAKHALNDGIDSADDTDSLLFEKEVLLTWAGPEIKARIGAFLGKA